MPCRPEHDLAGALSGAIVALVTSQATTPAEALGDAAAGAFGGWLGSRVPDALEPATHPGHRSVVHSIAANGTAAYFGAGPLMRWRLNTTDPHGELNPATRLASALTVGAATGHASHILLDATTPKGLPWIA